MVMLFGSDTTSKEATAKEAGSALIDALSYQDTSLRVHACIAMIVLGVHSDHMSKAVAALSRRVTEDSQSIVRMHAVVALGHLDQDARPAIPSLITASKDAASWQIREAAARALASAGRSEKNQPVDMRAAHALIAVSTGNPDACAEVRLAGVIGLGAIGTAPIPADEVLIVQSLARAVNDREKVIGIWAHAGLITHNDPATPHLAAICKHLKSTDKGHEFETHFQALRALGSLGTKAKSCLPDVAAGLEEKEPLLVAMAAWALGEMGGDAEKAKDKLNQLLQNKDTDERIKTTIKEALDKINGKKK
jgi:HEAT repeat protein